MHANNKLRYRLMVVAISLLLCPCVATAQTAAPTWIDSDVRNMQYPQDRFFSDFAEVPVSQGETQEQALEKAKQQAIGRVSDRVRVTVNTKRTSIAESQIGTGMDEHFRERFTSMVRTWSLTEIVGSHIESWYDSKTRTAYAFAYVSKERLASYYQSQISLWLNEVEGTLKIASDLVERGRKTQARKQCEDIVGVFAKVLYAQDLLTTINAQADDPALQQDRSQRLRNALVQTIVDLENSVFVYVKSTQDMEFVAEWVSSLLTENDCGCSFAENEQDADVVISITPKHRCTEAQSGNVFCYASATLTVLDRHSNKTSRPRVEEHKGGWTNHNYDKATEEAYKLLVKEIAEKVMPYLKK